MESLKTKMLFISGSGRSGSTILAQILGELNGFFNVGELSHVWRRGLLEGRDCGCGTQFQRCDVWNQIIEAGGGDLLSAKARRVSEAMPSARSGLRMLMSSRRCSTARYSEILTPLERLIGAVHETTGSNVIIDGSKLPTYGYLLGLIPSIDVFVVHLVRDPRAVAHSWMRKKLSPDRPSGKYMTTIGPTKSAISWTIWNAEAEIFSWGRNHRHMQLRYEDFVTSPRDEITSIVRFLDEDIQPLPFIDSHKVRLGQNHTVSGNPSRFASGDIELVPDAEWTSIMSRRNRLLVDVLTSPLRHHYGYSRTPRSPAE